MTAAEINEIQAEASRGWLAHKFFFYVKLHNFRDSLLPKFKTINDFRYSFGVFGMLLLRSVKPVLKNVFRRVIP
jgi:hypothetical protein